MRIGGKWRRDHAVFFYLIGMLVALPLLGTGVAIWYSVVGIFPTPPRAHIGIALGWAGGVLASGLIMLGLADLGRHALRLRGGGQTSKATADSSSLPGQPRESSAQASADVEVAEFTSQAAQTVSATAYDKNRRRDAASDAAVLSAFVSYSHKDERYRQALDTSLAQFKRNGLISVWYDRKILPGQQWDKEIDANLETADIVLVLVSPDFLASDYAYTHEMQRAIERHHAGLTTVIPVILRPSDWQNSPLGDLQALPSNGRPISIWPKRDQAWLDVVRELRRLVSSRG